MKSLLAALHLTSLIVALCTSAMSVRSQGQPGVFLLPLLEIEAEDALLSGAFEVGADTNASGGAYIHVPNGTPGTAAADFVFTVTERGHYALEGDVYALNGADDSFFVRVNGEPASPHQWNVAWNTIYASDFVNNAQTDKLVVYLTPGYQTVTVERREDGPRLDRLRLVASAPHARQFPPPPAAYVHPRVWTTAAELPQLKQNLMSSGFGAAVSPWLRNSANGQVGGNSFLRQLSLRTLTVDTVTESDINDFFFRFNDGSGYALGLLSIWGALFVDGDTYYVAEAKETAIGAVVNHGIITDHIHNRYRNNDYSGLSAATEAAIKGHWNRHGLYEFNLQTTWRNGGVGTALAYDMLYNDMTATQRAQARRGLALSTDGWNFRGGTDTNPVGFDGNAVSNHYGYQGDSLVMMAAIYGEDGFSQATWDQGVKMMQNYMRVSFNPSGYCLEDSYGPNLGLREGARALVAMARQGANEFAERPSAMYNVGVAVAHDIEAVPNASLIGGESGGNYAFNANSTSGENPFSIYPQFAVIWKHMYPDDPTIDHLYRWRMGDDYRRSLDWRATPDYAFFGLDLGVAPPDINLTKYFPARGKMIVRDDRSDEAVQFAFDARPDASNIGHDKAGRGYFSLNGLGRRWVSHLDFRYVELSTESSTMHIDGVGQAYKSPSVKVVSEPMDDGLVVSMAADLKYAYDWQWSEPWTWSANENPRPSANDWEHEPSNPRDFYRPGHAPDWVGTTLWNDPNSGYAGMWMWRRPNLPVEKAFRSVAYVRSDQPFVIISDDIKQDNQSRTYESYLQLPFDLDQMTVNGNDAIVSAVGDDRRLLVRVLAANTSNGAPATFRNEAFTPEVKAMDARRLIIGVDAVDPQLKVMLWPHRAGDALPQTIWNSDMTALTVGEIELNLDRSNGYDLFRNGRLEQSAESAVLTGSFEIAADPNAEGGLYIHVPNGAPGPGTAAFEFTVAAAGLYAIEGDVYAPNSEEDSFLVRVNDDPKTYLWDVAQGGGFIRDRVNDRGVTSQVVLPLPAGTHRVYVIHREDGTRLDQLRLVPLQIAPLLERGDAIDWTADADGNGQLDGIDYFLGSTTDDPALLSSVFLQPDGTSMWEIDYDPAARANWQIERSTDMMQWQGLDKNLANGIAVDPAAATIHANLSSAAGDVPRAMFRLRVEKP